MAVYKATYCYPMLKNLDIRIASDGTNVRPCEWMTCQIDSSNQKITGYQIRILDSENNQIFPSANSNGGKGYISPVEVSDLPLDPSDKDINSGYNGTGLKIPFFQNYNYSAITTENQMVTESFNAVYYIPKYKVDYILNESIANHFEVTDEDHLIYSGISPQIIDPDTNEVLVMGDTVLILTDKEGWNVETEETVVCEKGIFKVTRVNYRYRTYYVYLERVEGIDSNALGDHKIVVTQGPLHDKVLYFDEDEGEWVDVEDHSGLWVDIEGNPINIDVNGKTYKWEITLYQGEGVTMFNQITLNPGGADVEVYNVSYDDLSFKWFDTALNSGKILGSTNKRIQIASSLGDGAVLPLGTVGSPLVLQGTYIQLLDSNENPISNRAYVQNYDSTYGHVYPIAGGFSKEDINVAEKACFYKHSNNAEEVLARERVDYATTESDGNLAIYRQVSGRWEGNPDLGLPFIDGVQIKEGDVILVKNQERQCENGVYYAHAVGTAWSRSGSYKTWGDFIGATLLVVGGDTNGATNWESTAGAGGSLFGTNFPAGESPLFFVPEKPIILFYGGIKKQVNAVREKMYHELPNVTVETHGNYYKVTLVGGQIFEAFSDGTAPFNGQTILCYNDSHKIIEINSVTWDLSPLSPSVIIEYDIIDSAETGDYLEVLAGDDYGGHVVELQNDTLTIADEVKIAHILKNGVTHTYISPYIGLKSDMALKLLNNQEVTYQDNSVSNWIRIQSINTTVWRITHEELAEPLKSDSPVDSTIPFSYEVRTYYRASDENVFYTAESPYLRIQLLAADDGQTPLDVRYAEFEASYRQFQQSSWESYRWTLLDADGNLLQDTGLKYDRSISTTFYGLSNDDAINQYKAVLYVTDDQGNEIQGERTFTVGQGSVSAGAIFQADVDCSTHSILLRFGVEITDDNEYSIYRREYRKYERRAATPGALTPETATYQGAWEPVALRVKRQDSPLRDFNVKAGHSYQYIIYKTKDATARQNFANPTVIGPYIDTGIPVKTSWDEWSLVELEPVENAVDAPILRKTFRADLDNIWLFKYSLETGSQNQNFQKSEIQTLGRYQKIGYGRMNNISGDVSCFLGSEIVPYSSNGYIERMRNSIRAPLSTNEKALMLEKWRKIAFSPNPKLLKDMKGQSWIVQIMSSNNTPKNFYADQPDTISFSWKQIDSTDDVIIVGDGDTLPSLCGINSIWEEV